MTRQDFEQLKSIKGIGRKRYEAIASILLANDQTLNDLFTMSAEAIKATFGIPINVARTITEAAQQSPKSALSNIYHAIHTLRHNDDKYPVQLKQVLGDKTPKELHIWGNLALLDRPAVGFCGSRNVTEKGLQVTADTVEQITKLGWVTISGHARGGDTTAHRVALENGGATIIVIPQGIEGFKLRRELKEIATPEQILIISEFPPKAGWHVSYAMSRNKTIIGLSDAMVLIEAGMKGGTFTAGQQALQLKVPLFVADYELPTENAA